jgi:cobalt-zinc-cadmium efflux system outer membrane protein
MSFQFIRSFLITLLMAGATTQGETLISLTAEALRSNPELRSFEAAIASAKGGVRTAAVYANPELSVAPGVRRTTERGGAEESFHGNFELSQLFEFPGKRALKIAIAEKNVALQQLAMEGFRFALAAKVRRAFYDLLADEKIMALRHDQVDSAKTFFELSRKRAESGYASDFETLKSQAELIAAQRGLFEAQARMATARLTLNALLGRAPDSSFSVEGAIEEVSREAMPRPEFLSLAMARNPSLRALRVQAEVAGLSSRSARLGGRPDFALGPRLEYTKEEQIYGLGVTVALPFWDRKEGEVETASAEEKRILAELEKTRLEIAGAVTRATKELQWAREELALYTPAFLEQLKNLVAQAEKSYAQNATSLLIYLDAKRTYFDTLASYYEALGNLAEQGAELESAVGVPLDLPTSKPEP